MAPADPTGAAAAESVLLVEDDPAVAEILTTALGARGHVVTVARTGSAALRAAATTGPTLVLLDLGLPDVDGLEVCRRIRQHSDVPIIVVSADGDDERKVAALDLGADDYVTKPFSTPELLARLRVAARHRDRAPASAPPPRLDVGSLHIDRDAHVVRVQGRDLRLTHKEFVLLTLLAEEPGRLCTHTAIRHAVWGPGGGSSDALRVHVANVRRKLGNGPGVPEIRSEQGVGYRLVEANGG